MSVVKEGGWVHVCGDVSERGRRVGLWEGDSGEGGVVGR